MLPMTIPIPTLLEQLADVVTIVGLPGLIVSLFLATRLDESIGNQLSELKRIAQSQNTQLSELKRIAQSQNTIDLHTMVFHDPINIRIMGAIAANKPILKEHKGTFLSIQLDKYLGDFETVATVFDEGLFTKEQLDEHFSTFIEELAENREVAEYLQKYP